MKKVLSLLLAVIMTVSCFSLAFNAGAASYPSVSTNVSHASIGENVPLTFHYSPAYNYEKIELIIYDDDGEALANADFDFDNRYASAIQYFTANWDTSGYAEGRYRIEVSKYFYSFNTWNEAPTKSYFTITLKDDLKNGDPKRNAYSGSKETIKKSSFDKVTAKKNTICSAYSAWDEVKINGCTLRLTKMYLGTTANDMVREENMYNPKANSSTNWIFMDFELHNGTKKEVSASDFVSILDIYKSTGNEATVIGSCTMGGSETGHFSTYLVDVQPGETKTFSFAVLLPKSQGMPYIQVADNYYINTNPSASKTEKHYEKTKVTKASTSENGTKAYTCSVCGKKTKTTTIYRPKTVTLSYTSKNYTGNALQPKVVVKDSKSNVIDAKYYTVSYKNNKNVGKATVTVKFKGDYKGTITKTFKINPKGTSVTKVNAKSKGLEVTWKKQTTQTTGYQIQYSTSSKFTEKTTKSTKVTSSSTASKTILSLKGSTTYYVRIRTYKVVSGTNYYSDWSKTLSAKTKK